ncbi:MAG: prepilin peptidase [Candidatus Eremiobacteraeota bacterium]|nr:prepilin peptidase [Candidatus Eremiobacteraeota bacterium]MBC5802909.1 prepilin peptidase [Candidatus Eremiobacteraeota bacterium]MBC5821131.1 prepilin peptidase [Candidatus Eremiobacteraeota bacterium]
MNVLVVGGCLCAWVAIAFAATQHAEAKLPGCTAALSRPAVVVAVLLALLALLSRPPAGAAVCGVACVALVAAAASDARTGYLFDAITFPTALLVASLALWTGAAHSAAAGVALMVGCFGGIVVVSRGRWMGLGDVKALYAVGAAFGPLESLLAIFAASLCAIVTSAVAGRLRRGHEIRFGPHLAAGAALVLVAGEPIVHGWMHL